MLTASCHTRPSTKKEFYVFALPRLLYAKNQYITVIILEFYAYKTLVIFIMGISFHILKLINKAEKNGGWPSGAFEEMQLFWLCNIRPAHICIFKSFSMFMRNKSIIMHYCYYH